MSDEADDLVVKRGIAWGPALLLLVVGAAIGAGIAGSMASTAAVELETAADKSETLATQLSEMKTERDGLRSELAAAKKGIDECQNGPGRLLNLIEGKSESGDHREVVTVAERLIKRHPGSPEAKKAEALRAKAAAAIEKEEAEERAMAEKLEREAEQEARRAESEEERRRKRALRNMRKDRDDFRGITWYRHKKFPRYNSSRSQFTLYFGMDDAGRPLAMRMVVGYEGDNWLFVRQYSIKAGETTFNRAPEFKKDNAAGRVWEWADTMMTGGDLLMVRAMLDAKKATIRFNGSQYYSDYKLRARDRDAIKETLEAFEALGGSLPSGF